MGDRANILVREDNNDSGVYLYTHWGGSRLLLDLRNALAMRRRWDDTPYLTRIIFDQMAYAVPRDTETGYGILTRIGDTNHALVTVNVDMQEVTIDDIDTWTFTEFSQMSNEVLKQIEF